MRSIKAVFRQIKDYDPTISDIIVFGRAVSGRRFTHRAVRENLDRLVDPEDYGDVSKLTLARHFLSLTNTGLLYLYPRSQPFDFIRRHPKNFEWRDAVIKRDGGICQICDYSGKHIEVDHIYPLQAIVEDHDIKDLKDALKVKQLWDIDNGRVLCKPCHYKTETYGRRKMGNKIERKNTF